VERQRLRVRGFDQEDDVKIHRQKINDMGGGGVAKLAASKLDFANVWMVGNPDRTPFSGLLPDCR
jgi:hypothetical protein